MAKIRLILASPHDGSLNEEEMIWTADFETPAADFVNSSMKVYFDKVIEADLPHNFPFESNFSKTF